MKKGEFCFKCGFDEDGCRIWQQGGKHEFEACVSLKDAEDEVERVLRIQRVFEETKEKEIKRLRERDKRLANKLEASLSEFILYDFKSECEPALSLKEVVKELRGEAVSEPSER